MPAGARGQGPAGTPAAPSGQQARGGTESQQVNLLPKAASTVASGLGTG